MKIGVCLLQKRQRGDRRVENHVIILALAMPVFLILAGAFASAAQINLQKTAFMQGETVLFDVSFDEGENQDGKIQITSSSEGYELFGDAQGEHRFIPQYQGQYQILLRGEQGDLIAKSQFIVLGAGESENSSANSDKESNQLYVSSDRGVYFEGEQVKIAARGESQSKQLFVIGPQGKKYEFLGENSDDVSFYPDKPGEYEIILEDDFSRARALFSVEKKDNSMDFAPLRIVNARNLNVQSRFTFSRKDSVGLLVSGMQSPASSASSSSVSTDGGILADNGGVKISQDEIREGSLYSAQAQISGSDIKKIKIESLRYEKGKSVGIDEFRATDEIDGNLPMKSFAINLEGLQFDTAEVTVTARGTQLYECKQWNFEERLCNGTWTKKMNIIPGTEYALSLTPGDPGYAELGVASINTEKSIYLPFDNATIIIAVLDSAGYLVSGAQIELNVTSPSGEIITLTSLDGIAEIEKGIYEAYYLCGEEGNYALSASALGTNVNNSMTSYFLVSTTHEFDILRDSPITTDPFRESFLSSLQIIFRNASREYATVNLTEKVPADFTIIDAGSAEVSRDDNYYYLKWSGLSNSAKVGYEAIPPLISPQLWELRSFVDYDSNVFDEARPWFIAVDPSLFYDPNRTITAGWNAGTGTTFAEIDDAVRQPSIPDTNNYVASLANAGVSSNFAFPNITEAYIDNMTLWIYTGTGSNALYTFNLMQNGVSRCSSSIARSTATGWYNCSWQNPTGDFSNMTLYLSAVTKSGGGASTTAYVYASYLEVALGNYPPNVTLLKPDNNSFVNVSLIDFNFTVSDDRDSILKNCTLWSNFTGTWLANATANNVQNGSVKNITVSVPDGQYIWNIQCYDQGNKFSFAPQNYTLKVNALSPAISSIALNATSINQSNSVRFNASITDFYGVSSAYITILYPNSSRQNITLQASSNEYSAAISNTNQTGTYNITLIWANDTLGRIAQNNNPGLSFSVVLSPPAPFQLMYPANNTESKLLLPNFSWTQTSDETFANYTLYIDKDASFSSPDFQYYIYQITNVSYIVPYALDANAEYYWKVSATDYYSSQTNSTQTFRYVTDLIAPNVSLLAPQSGDYSTQQYVEFQYTPKETNTLMRCDLYTNSTGAWGIANFSLSPAKGILNSLFTQLPEGYTLWNINCTDKANNSAFSEQNRTIIVDLTGPVIDLKWPANYSNITTTNIVNFTASAVDALAGISSCELLINSESKQSKNSIAEGLNFTFSQFLTNGVYNWSVRCTDTNLVAATSQERIINVSSIDADAPVILQNYPSPGGYVSLSDVTFNYTPQDATGFANCSLFIDGVLNKTDFNIENLEPNYFTVNGFTQALHTWNITCYDNSSYYNRGSAKANFTVDLANPSVLLHVPSNGAVLNRSSVQFNYTPNDTNIEKCELWANFTGTWSKDMENSSAILNNQVNTFQKILPDGAYIWNVLCTDKSQRSSSFASNYSVKIDTKAPEYSGLSVSIPSPASYLENAIYNFNITWTLSGLDTVIFESNITGSWINQTISENNGYFNISFVGLAPGIYAYRWHANDSAGNRNSTAQFSYAVEKAQSQISLYLNGINSNQTINEDSLATIKANITLPRQGMLYLYEEGNLINSGMNSITNSTSFENPGIYNITAVYSGNENYSPSAQTLFFTVLDITNPLINLSYPSQGSTIASGDTGFQYTVTDFSQIVSCDLYINGIFNQSSSDIDKQSVNTFVAKINAGAYNWRVECNDSSNNRGTSQTYSFNAVDTTAMGMNLSSSNYNAERGEKINLTVNITNAFGGPLSADIRTDIISGFTGAGWWNASWKSRKPIFINETLGVNHLSEIVEINISGLGSAITSCSRELRIVNNISADLFEVPFQVYSGDDSSWCLVAFRVNLSANALNQNNYYAYYNNSAAPIPSYNVITSEDKLYFAQAAAADEGTPLNVANIIGYNDTSAATMSVSGGGAGAVSAHGRGFINTSQTNLILKVQARYRFEVNSISGNWYLRYSVNDGTSYSNSFTGTTTQAKTTTSWADITSAYSALTWTELNRTRLQGRADKGSGSGTSSLLLYWVELNVTSRIKSNITQVSLGSSQQHIFTSFNQTDLTGVNTIQFDTKDQSYGNYSVVSSASKQSYGGAIANISLQIKKDTTPPNVTLLSPHNLEERGEGNVSFTYRPYDINLKNCSLFIENETDFYAFSHNTSPLNGENNTFSGPFYSVGLHDWNVLCYDSENNSAFAKANFTLNISAANLRVRTQDIYFDESDRIEGTNITVYAKVTNVGLSNANNSFIVQFYKGDPDSGGVQIGSDISLENLSVGNTSTLSTQFALSAGKNEIFVIADAYDTVNETTENDNKAGNNVSVPLYQYYYGNVSKSTALGKTFSSSMIIFENETAEGGNIYFADADSDFAFTDLQALTKNKIGQTVGDDFSNLDSAMGTQTFDDSVKQVWGAGTDNPVQFSTFNVSGTQITNVPVVNSTVNENFVTGILWDTADDLGNLQYDEADKEDVVFVTNINLQKVGEYGIYDAEIKVPATLRDYRGTDSKVVFYVEIE